MITLAITSPPCPVACAPGPAMPFEAAKAACHHRAWATGTPRVRRMRPQRVDRPHVHHVGVEKQQPPRAVAHQRRADVHVERLQRLGRDRDRARPEAQLQRVAHRDHRGHDAAGLLAEAPRDRLGHKAIAAERAKGPQHFRRRHRDDHRVGLGEGRLEIAARHLAHQDALHRAPRSAGSTGTATGFPVAADSSMAREMAMELQASRTSERTGASWRMFSTRLSISCLKG